MKYREFLTMILLDVNKKTKTKLDFINLRIFECCNCKILKRKITIIYSIAVIAKIYISLLPETDDFICFHFIQVFNYDNLN